jgi:O-methyltransferase
MTEPEAVDGHSAIARWHSGAHGEHNDWAYAPEEEVRRNLLSTGLDRDRLHLVKGPVEDTIPGQAPDSIALLRLDTDWYRSTLHELTQLWPRLAQGGVLIIDDYGYWDGARRAVDEFFGAMGAPPMLSRIDSTGRLAIKTR